MWLALASAAWTSSPARRRHGARLVTFVGPDVRHVLGRLVAFDAGLARRANAAAHRHSGTRWLVGAAAAGLAAAEIALMCALGLSGRPRAVLRMLLAVSTVYVTVELVGRVWPRPRPFAAAQGHGQVAAVVPHDPRRSFPSRHVASTVAMARVGTRARPRLGRTMAVLAAVLAVARVGAGLHYPSDGLGGAALGWAVGGLFQDWP